MSKPNYYKEAFFEVSNLIIIISIGITSVIGFKNIATYCILLEIVYMLKVPNEKAFKNHINLKNNYNEELESSISELKESEDLLNNLSDSYKEKFKNIEYRYNEIIKSMDKKPEIKEMTGEQIKQLEYLLFKYTNFSETLSYYTEYLNKNTLSKVNNDIDDLKQRINNCFEKLEDNNVNIISKKLEKKTLLKNNLSISQKRLEKINELTDLSETLKIQLDIIQDTFYLIVDHIKTFTPGNNLDFDVNSIISNVESTDEIIRQTQKEMSKFKKIEML